jgi:dTDP-4-dehydrorhamnose reductase
MGANAMGAGTMQFPPSIFITGGSGLLALSWALAVRQHFEVTLGLHSRHISLSGVRSQYVDLRSVSSVQSVLERDRPLFVVHAAGMTNVEACEASPDLAHHVNVTLARNVARACAGADIPLAHISTDHLFSTSAEYITESEPVSPVNVYGKSKAQAEEEVLASWPNALIVRTNFYAWGPPYRRSFSDAIVDHLRAGRSVDLFDDVYYTPILAETLALSTHELIARAATGVYNIVGDARLSKYDFGVKLAERFGLAKELIRRDLLSQRAQLVRRPFEMSLSNAKVCSALKRQLGGVDEHLGRLAAQRQHESFKEIEAL